MAGTFVGRDAELAAIGDRLKTARLVTLLGIGGIGKSRLAHEYAARQAADVHLFCDLSAARNEEEICTAVGSTLEVGLAVAGSVVGHVDVLGKALAARAAERGCLLVLDGLEAVAAPVAPILERWLDAAPRATILITSRVRLGAAGEQVIAVEPLRMDADVGLSDAEQLFLERARAAGSTLTGADTPDVRALVRALDGIPLAIELVAARTRLLPVRQLLARVLAGQELANDDGRASKRHGTMRSVVAGSWELLSEEAKEDLLACACFHGGFSLESTEHMLAPRGLERIARLVDASLVRSTPTRDGAARFDLFQTVRTYADERMAERPELRRTLFRRHARHMAEAGRAWHEAARDTAHETAHDAAHEAAHEKSGAVHIAVLAREHDNLVAALTRLLTDEPIDAEGAQIALTLAVELEPIRMLRGHASTYVRWLRAASAAVPNGPMAPELRSVYLGATLCEARALLELGVVDESRTAFGRALALALEAQDGEREGYARYGLARLDAHSGQWQRALSGFGEVKVCAVRTRNEALLHLGLASESFHGSELRDAEEHLGALERAAKFFRTHGDERESLSWTVQLGRAYVDFDRQDKAQAQLVDALSRARAIGDRRTEGFASFGLGGVHLSRGELDLAAQCYATATEIFGEVGKGRERGYALGYLGVVEHLLERFVEAEASYAAGCAVLSEVGDEPNAVLFTLFLAGLLADLDRPKDAAARFGGARAEAWAGSGMRPVVAEVSGAMLDASRARAAWRRKDFDGFAAHRRAADLRLRRAEETPEHIESAKEVYDWRDVSLDVRAAYRLSRRAVDALAPLRLPAECIVIVDDCVRIRTRSDGHWVDLGTRRVLRRVLARLVEARLATPGVVVSAKALVEAGWPGEHMAERSANNRLHVTLGMLRRLGLDEILEHVPGGWRLRADVPLVRLADRDAGTA